MNELKQSFEILEQAEGFSGVNEMIELCGRVSYKSEDKINSTSAPKFVSMLENSKHYAPTEFGTIYLKVPTNRSFMPEHICNMVDVLLNDKYTKYGENDGWYYITTNKRVINENKMADLMSFMCATPTSFHHRRYCVKISTCRQITHELVRHRGKKGFSFMQESSRYVNYFKEKFGKAINIIRPFWLDDKENNSLPKICSFTDLLKRIWSCIKMLFGHKDYNLMTSTEIFLDAEKRIEKAYFELIQRGWKPQQTALLLTNATKSDICICGFVEDWEHLFDLRTSLIHLTGMPHPLMSEIVDEIYKEFVRRKYIDKRD